jgi:hypothetical protein
MIIDSFKEEKKIPMQRKVFWIGPRPMMLNSFRKIALKVF